jgi:hypothetical protein
MIRFTFALLKDCASSKQSRMPLINCVCCCTASSYATLTASPSLGEPETDFIGAYTPVTRQLWQERLRLARLPPQQHLQQQLRPETPRPPQAAVIKYQFSNDKYLLEMVSSHT